MITYEQLKKSSATPLEEVDTLIKLGFYEWLWGGLKGVDFKTYKHKGVWYVKGIWTNWEREEVQKPSEEAQIKEFLDYWQETYSK